MSRRVVLKGHYHQCPKVTNKVPHIGGVFIEGDEALTVNGIPVVLKGHRCSCQVGPYDSATQGYEGLTVNGSNVVLTGMGTAHGGVVIQGDDALIIE